MAKYLNKKVKEYFRRDNAASVWWNVDNLPRYNKQIQWMFQHIDFSHKKVLDLATGKGRFSIGAALKGAEFITGVDISKQMLSEALEKAKKYGVESKIRFQECDIEDFFSEDKYDVIILMEVLVHLPNPELVLSKCYNMLRKNGLLILNVDFPIADNQAYQYAQEMIKITYNLLPNYFRRKFNKKFGWPVCIEKKIIKETTDDTLLEMELHPEIKYCRAKDAFRPISYSELVNYLTRIGFKILKSKQEYYLGIKIGCIFIASKEYFS